MEPLLRIFLAEHGRKADATATLREVRSQAAARLVSDAETSRGYLDGEGQFPRRIAQVTLIASRAAIVDSE
ncbi:hypothetical protein [Spelaeicoccus albus]|uniref:Uncharacterized protein n=1 Tax=Spelaeicoccus albus TaxID=1280376 RepID=A0A7Z0IHI4_9MICO|nr:hypothetical protein [Spelaeicoccus albus]NYI67582.1 hypothetical protein [Spelaeicoccus albus]